MTMPPIVDRLVKMPRRSLGRRGATNSVRQRVDLPLVICEPVSDPRLEVTPERAAALRLAEEAAGASAP